MANDTNNSTGGEKTQQQQQQQQQQLTVLSAREGRYSMSPVSALGSPMSVSGSCGVFGSRRESFEPNSTNCSLDRFMEALEALSPAGDNHTMLQHLDKRQSIGNDSFIGGGHRMSCGSNSSIIGINSVMGLGPNSAVGTHSLLSPCSPGLLTPNDRQQHQQHQHGHFTRARRSPCKREDDSGGAAAVSPLSRTGGAGGGALVARRSLSCSPSCSSKRKRSYTQLLTGGDENGAPSPFPHDGSSKSTSRALSKSQLTIHQDGAYMQVVFDETHRFACEEDPPDLALLHPTMMAMGVADTNAGAGGRNDIDQALSLLKLSGGTSTSQTEFLRSTRRLSGGKGMVGPGNDDPRTSRSPQEFNENIMPGSSMVATSAVSSSTAAAAPSMDHPNNHHQQTTSGWPFVSHAPLSPFTAPSLHAQEQQQQQQSQTTAAASLSTAPDEGDFSKSHPSTAALDAAAATAATRLLGKPPEPPAVASGRIKSKATVTRTGNCGDAHRPASGNTAKISKTVKTIKATSTKGVTKGKPKPRGTGGGQRPAVQAPVSTPQGTVGGGPGSFCSKPEALSQLDTSQSELMVLDADLWIVRERGDLCSSNECIYKDKSTGVSSRRHYHATCDHRHKGGPKGGMIFHHHQLEKIQKHQRAHIRILHKKTPAEAVLTEANVEPYLPEAWTEQETGVLEHLVGIYGPTHWSTIAAGVATKSETQCMLHWRFALNGNATVKGTGTWQPVEDDRMLSLVQIFGQRWSTVAEHMPGRLAKQCRERYLNNLDPDLRRGAWSRQEDEKLLQLRGQQNKSFAKIAEQIDGRSYNDVKNRWSQISRQIAALKASLNAKGWTPDETSDTKPEPESSSTSSDNIFNIDNVKYAHDKLGVGINQSGPSQYQHRQTSPAPAGGTMSTDQSSNSNVPLQQQPVKYKVLSMEDGVLSLGEDGEDGNTGDEKSVSPPPSGGTLAGPPSSSSSSSSSSPSLQHPPGDASESSHDVSGLLRPEYAPQAAAMQSVSVGSAAAAAAGRAEDRRVGAGAGVRGNWGHGGGTGNDDDEDGGPSGGPGGVFDGELSDGEADAIAGSSFMRFSNDMRVSI